MQPDPTELLDIAGISTPLIGLYCAPDPSLFEPTVRPQVGTMPCVFTFYKKWLRGEMLHLTETNVGCRGCGRAMFGRMARTREELIRFLVDGEGLKANHEIMGHYVDDNKTFQGEYPHIFIGPLKNDRYEYCHTITFLVNPDELSLLMTGAQYYTGRNDPQPVLAPFGAGCMQLFMFRDPGIPQAIIGGTDIAMRQYLPSDILAFTVTKPMFKQLCELDHKSFLHKPFWKKVRSIREKK